ncbi:MAG: poly-gamma-glutamate synthase PgsB [Kosmotogaceae bacterium]|nr:poly-gamma-glutamate synthase PgsB [Kosmotogaceae bacterium]
MNNIILAGIALVILLSAMLAENVISRKRKARLRVIVQVNGTRGKSETVRLIHGALKGNGFRVLGKTTGTVPLWITPEGKHVEIIRRGPANIQEQFLALRKSWRDKCDALVVECMAIKPEMQLASGRILDADITVITNTYPDHIEEMGNTEEETAGVLSLSIAPGKTCIVGSLSPEAHERIKKTCEKIETELIGAAPSKEDLSGFRFLPHNENLSIAAKVVELLGLDKSLAIEGMKEVQPDVGTFRYLMLGCKTRNAILANAFAANDLHSTSLLLEKVKRDFPEKDIIGFFNSRDDRPDRAAIFETMIRSFDRIIVRGPLPRRILKSKSVEKLDDPSQLDSHLNGSELVFGFGNIRGLVDWLNGMEEIS